MLTITFHADGGNITRSFLVEAIRTIGFNIQCLESGKWLPLATLQVGGWQLFRSEGRLTGFESFHVASVHGESKNHTDK